jgi:pimeloyl-ACP methyl ester carboxylesterase
MPIIAARATAPQAAAIARRPCEGVAPGRAGLPMARQRPGCRRFSVRGHHRPPLADLLAEQIQGPVLLVHGTADRSVPFDRSENMASAR